MIRRCALATGVAALIALAATPASAEAATIFSVSGISFSSGTVHSQSGRVNPDGGASSCNAFPGVEPPTSLTNSGVSFRAKSHQVRSVLLNAVCATVDVDTACSDLFSVAYGGAYDPASPVTGRVADIGHATGTPLYSYVAGGRTTSNVVVHETSSACASGYNLVLTSNRPWATTAPQIAGTPAIGTAVTGGDAGWLDTPSVARQWVRCDMAGEQCGDIPGATGAAYTVTDADLGHTLRFRNAATDGSGTSSSQSVYVEPYIPIEAHGSETLGGDDHIHNGFFIRNLVESRCAAPNAAPAVLQPASLFFYDAFRLRSLLNEQVCLVAYTLPTCFGGVTPAIYDPAFDPAQGLVGNYAANSGGNPALAATVSALMSPGGSREVLVSRGNTGGTCDGYSVTIGVNAPFATARPALVGTAADGGTLTATDGSWSGTPSLAHSWLRCEASGSPCTPIPGAGGASYTVTAVDAGARLRARVTATQGQLVSSDSEPSEVVPAPPGAATSGTDVTGPVVRVRLGSRSLRRALRTRRVPVKVRCNEACAGRVELRVSRRLAKRLKLRSRVIARVTRAAPAGQETTFRARLTRRARRALRALSLVRFNIVARLADAAGNSSRVTARASLRRPRR